MKAGYYLNSRGNLAIIYPDKNTEVWVDSKDNVFLSPEKWLKFQMNNLYESMFEWEFLGDL